MGAYGPQLSTKQRWMIVDYINSKQAEASGGAAPAAADSTAAPATDSAKAKK